MAQSVATAPAADATQGQPIIAGQDNDETSPTGITNASSSGDGLVVLGAGLGNGVKGGGGSNGGTGVVGTGGAGGNGVVGNVAGNGIGVVGTGGPSACHVVAWIRRCQVAWIVCASHEKAIDLEQRMKKEWMPPLTRT